MAWAATKSDYLTGDLVSAQEMNNIGTDLDYLKAALDDYIIIRDEKTSGTEGGTSTASTWQTRDLNTEVLDGGGHASLSANQVTLAAGTYRLRASAPAHQSGAHRVRLRNVSDNTTVAEGPNNYANPNTSYHGGSTAVVSGRFTIAASKTFELQHYVSNAKSNNGLGMALSTGDSEIYAVLELWKED